MKKKIVELYAISLCTFGTGAFLVILSSLDPSELTFVAIILFLVYLYNRRPRPGNGGNDSPALPVRPLPPRPTPRSYAIDRKPQRSVTSPFPTRTRRRAIRSAGLFLS
jgi:hypothetical protein